MSTLSPEYGYLAGAEEPREHTDMNPEFSDQQVPDGADPAAPWGRKADGTPKAKPGRPAGTPDSNPRTRRPAPRRARVTAAAPRKRESKPRSGKAQMPDYRPGITGILQLIAAPLAIAGAKSPTAALDAAAVTVHAEPIAEALQQTAEQVPQVAAVLERVLTVGPYGALLAAVMPLGVQLLVNHRVVPLEAAEALGALSPEDLMAQLAPDAQAA